MEHFCVEFRVHGLNIDHEYVTNIIGVQPTHIHNKGEASKWGARYQLDSWQFGVTSTAAEENSFNQMIKRLPEKIFCKATIETLKSRYTLDIYFGITTSHQQSAFCLDTNSIAVLNRLGIGFEVCILLLGPDTVQLDTTQRVLPL